MFVQVADVLARLGTCPDRLPRLDLGQGGCRAVEGALVQALATGPALAPTGASAGSCSPAREQSSAELGSAQLRAVITSLAARSPSVAPPSMNPWKS
ncbi:hypothetical protein GCM10017778_32370 [Streptomyces vinaceus]|nr:hypothetical protein GCM10017778_32370 [Streptomyces vinaceus]